MKISLNLTKLDASRARQGSVNKENRFVTLLLQKRKEPDEDGYDYVVTQAQTLQERKSNAKPLYVGKAKSQKLAIGDEDKDKFFMLFAEEGGAPTVKQPNIKTAFCEGARIARITNKPVYILEVTGVITPKVRPVSEEAPQIIEEVMGKVEEIIPPKKTRKRISKSKV